MSTMASSDSDVGGGGDSVSTGVQLRGLGAAVVKQDSFTF
jgi:hypothetical protein